MGTSAAIIQAEVPSKQLLDTVFWFNLALGLFLGGIVVATSHLASLAFREPRIQTVLIFLAMSFPIASLAMVQLTLMERASRFRHIAWVEISSSLLGLILGAIAAWHGLGVYSLVVQTLITVTAT